MTAKDKRILKQMFRYKDKLKDCHERLTLETQEMPSSVCDDMPWFSEISALDQSMHRFEHLLNEE